MRATKENPQEQDTPLDQIGELENAIAEARAQLEKADQQHKADLEAQIGQKTQQLEGLKNQQQDELSQIRAERDSLLREKRDREIQTQAQQVAQQIQAGLKTAQEAEQQRVSTMIQAELGKVLGTTQSAFDIKSLVYDALGEIRTGRKFVPDSGDGRAGAGDSTGEQGRRGGPAYLAAHKMGEKPSFLTFLLAAGRKDDATVRDIQSHYGMATGRKALIEGGGAIDSTGGPSGGYLVPVEFSNQVIEALTAQVVVRRAGPIIQTMNSPVYRQPRVTSLSTASWVGETVPILASQPSFDQLSLQAKKLTALVPISAELINDSDPAVEQIVTRNMARSIALKEDHDFLVATGSTTVPQGILTASGVTTINATGGNGDAISYTTITRMIGALDAANVPEQNRVWLANPRIREAISNVVDTQNRPIFAAFMNAQQGSLLDRAPTLMGYPFLMSTQMPLGTTGSGATASLALVDFGYVLLGQLAELELKVSTEGSYVDGSSNTHSAFQDDLFLYRGVLREDLTLTHPSAVVNRTGLLY